MAKETYYYCPHCDVPVCPEGIYRDGKDLYHQACDGLVDIGYPLTFDEWMIELKKVAVEKCGYGEQVVFDRAAWEEFYNDGWSPEDALDEDFSNA